MKYHRLKISRRKFLGTIGVVGAGAAVWSIMPAFEGSSINLASAARSRRLIATENARKGTTSWRSPELAKYKRSSHDTEIPPKWKGRGPGGLRGATQANGVTQTNGSSRPGGMAQFLDVSMQTQQSTYTPNPICGFADQTSINTGGTITFFISTTLPTYRIDVYRMGYYNGDGGRLVTTINSLTGQNQTVPLADRRPA